MPTTKDDIREWLQRGKNRNDDGETPRITHLLVVCDTYDWSDYPVFVDETEDVHKKAAANNGPNMTKLMEVYKLDMDWDQQLAQHRAFNY